MLIRLTLAALLAFVLSNSAEAGLFRKVPKPDAATYVPKLVEVLKASTDEKLRVQAANELRDYDAKAFPEILPALIDALSGDASATVRAEAAESIGKVRPVTAQAGYALEQARSNDKQILVRLAAQRALLHYRILGVIGQKEDLVLQTAEPPLAAAPVDAKANAGSVILRPTPSPVPVAEPVAPPPGTKVVGPVVPPVEPKPGTFEPPLAEPKKPAVPTAQPRSPTPIVMIPTVPVKPEPKDLPTEVSTPEKPVKEGPALPPPPKQ